MPQAFGWGAIVAFGCVYFPSAITALTAPSLIAIAGQKLIVPSGEAFIIRDIEGISLKRGIWHRYMRVRVAGTDTTVIVTFARGMLADMKRAFEAEPLLRQVPIG